jgi:hypothetical protein
MALVEQRLRHDADRIREVDDPRVRGECSHALGDVEHNGHRAQRLGEPAEAGRLLPEAPARERHRLVDHARRLPADADLHEHRVGAFDRILQPRRGLDTNRMPGAVQHAAREPGDDLQPLVVRVVQPEIIHVDAVAQPHEAVDHLRRVRRAGADDRELHAGTTAFARAQVP